MKEEINGILLNYSRSGIGQPLILLHGNGEDHTIFDELTEKLKPHFCVYAIDSRNHGNSSKTDDYSYEIMAADIAAFIKKKNLIKPFILGFSDGAIIALTLALQYNGIFAKMALLGINLKPDDFKPEIYKEIQEGYAQTKDPLLKLMLEQPDIELSGLKDIATPTLLVAAENDIFKGELFTNIVNTMPDASLEIIKGHDHGSYIVHEDILYPSLKEFFGK